MRCNYHASKFVSLTSANQKTEVFVSSNMNVVL